MSTFQKKMASLKLIRAMSSLKIMVTCLAFLFILTFWGTVAQAQHGLYNAQARYFNSFFFLALGFIPFPGAQLVMWVLFVNLLSAASFRFAFNWKNLGILIIHFGLLTYLVGSFVTLYGVKESNLTLQEGASSNVSSSYHDWEIAVWKGAGGIKKVTAYDSNHLKEGQTLDFKANGLDLKVQSYYVNADAYGSGGEPGKVLNASGIATLKPKESFNEPEKNTPGALLQIADQKGEGKTLLLFGGDSTPTTARIGNDDYSFSLRRKLTELPMTVKLKDFQMEVHPNTDVARSYKSLVTIDANDLSRDVLISMNNPLRYKGYTFYQASYSIDAQGHEFSTLAVVSNSGRMLPYISSLVTFLGLAIHFLSKAFMARTYSKVRANA